MNVRPLEKLAARNAALTRVMPFQFLRSLLHFRRKADTLPIASHSDQARHRLHVTHVNKGTMKTKLITIALASAFTFVLAAQQQRNSSVRPTAAAAPDARIVSKLTEIVGIRERAAKNYDQMLAAGRASRDGLAEVELAEARVDLAREQGQSAAVITELQGLVAAHERRTKWMAGVARDRIAPEVIDRAQVALLEAQVRLLRAQK
jgi:hypothetical protein